MPEPLLKWTGHPLADVGVATLCAMAGLALAPRDNGHVVVDGGAQ